MCRTRSDHTSWPVPGATGGSAIRVPEQPDALARTPVDLTARSQPRSPAGAPRSRPQMSPHSRGVRHLDPGPPQKSPPRPGDAPDSATSTREWREPAVSTPKFPRIRHLNPTVRTGRPLTSTNTPPPDPHRIETAETCHRASSKPPPRPRDSPESATSAWETGEPAVSTPARSEPATTTVRTRHRHHHRPHPHPCLETGASEAPRRRRNGGWGRVFAPPPPRPRPADSPFAP